MNFRGTFISMFLLTLLGVAGEKQLVILQTSDVHGRIEYGKENQGWLKLSTLIKQEREKAKGRCLYIDCGDSIQGTHVESIFKGEAALVALNHLKPDAWVPGNHEFDFGVDRLCQLISSATFPVLNGNVTFSPSRNLEVKGYRMTHVNGLKVAIIGLNTGKLKSWYWGKGYEAFEVTSAVEYLEKTLPEIQKESPNMIVLGIHQGLLSGRKSQGEVYDICKRFPQIDLILGGHTHESIPGKRIWGSYVVQPGPHGENLSRVVVTFDKGGRIRLVQSSLLDALSVEPDPELKKHLKPYSKRANSDAFQVISKAPKDVTPSGLPGVNNLMSGVFYRAIRKASQAHAVLHGVHNTFVWEKGNIQLWQLFSGIPYENKICVVELSERELKRIIEEQLAVKPRERMMGIHGIKITIKSDGKTVDRIEMPAGKKTVKLALTDFAIAGGGWRYPILRETLAPRRKSIRELNIRTRDAVKSYIETSPEWYQPPQKWMLFQSK